MTEQQNLDLTKKYAHEVWTRGNLDAIDDFLAEDFEMGYPLPGLSPDREGFKQFAGMMRAAFPDLKNTVEECFAAGDRVVQRWRSDGTHKGELFGAPATGREVSFHGISVYEVRDGRIQRDWTVADLQGMMQQLGLAPQPGD